MSEAELVEVTVELCRACADFTEVTSKDPIPEEESMAALFRMIEKAREFTEAIAANPEKL